MPLTVTVTGASGFVGSHLCQALVDAGHTVRAMTRHPDDYDGAGEAVYGDVSETGSLAPALDGADAAYYLVHSLDRSDFEDADAHAARDFSAAANDSVIGPTSRWLIRHFLDSCTNSIGSSTVRMWPYSFSLR